MTTTEPPPTAASIGLFSRARTRLFGERDPVAAQLRDIARQGSGMANLAHAAAFLLLVLFSLGSLIALGRDPLARILYAWWQLHIADIPDAVSLAVIALLVLCMDMAMFYAASKLRVLATRRIKGWVEYALHIAVIVVACLLEAGTYIYMSWLYEHPAGWLAWSIIVARALAAPLFAVYLSLSRTIPIGVDDITHQVELATGAGIIRDAVTIANDPTAPLAHKVRLFMAAAELTDKQHTKLANLADALGAYAIASDTVVDALPAPSRPPTGPGTPAVSGNGDHDDDGDYDTQISLPAVRIVRPDQSSHSSQRNPQRMRGQGGPNDSQVSGRSSPRHSKSGRRGPQRRQVEPAGPRIVAAIESNPALVRSATQGPRVRATAQVASVAPSTVSRHSRSNPAVAAAAQRVAQ